jgi:tetratricopeptide (TPR) repeat protein
MEPEGYSFRRIERERLAKDKARERRRRTLLYLKYGGLFLVLAGAIASITYWLYGAPGFSLPTLLAGPRRLISAVILVNGAPHPVPADGTLSLNPGDMVKVDRFQTDSRFAWGLSLEAEQFPAKQLLEGERKIGDFWPDYDFAVPLEITVAVTAGSKSIGRFCLEIRVGEHEWVERAQAAGDVTAKIEYLERAASLAPQNALILLNLGILYGEKGDWAKAAATYERLAVSSATREILEKLVEAHQRAGNVDRALDGYLKLIETSSPDKEPLSRFVSYLSKEKGARDAAAYLVEKVNSFPAALQPDVHAYLGSLLGQQGRWKEAAEAYERALAAGDADPVIYLRLGEAHSRRGDYEAAERSLLTYLKQKPEDGDAKVLLAKVYKERKSYIEAIDLLKELVRANPQELKGFFALADTYERAKMSKEAAAVYEQICALAPDNREAHYKRGVLYFTLKQYDRATEAFSQAARIDGKDIDSREYLLRIYQDQKDLGNALAVLEELIELRPTHWDYYPRAFTLYGRLRAYERMTDTFARAVERAQDRGDLRFYLGVSYEKRGLLVQAEEQLEAAVRLSPRNKDYLKHLAAVHDRLGEVDAALAAYRKVLELDPDDSKAQDHYLRLKVMRIQQAPAR